MCPLQLSTRPRYRNNLAKASYPYTSLVAHKQQVTSTRTAFTELHTKVYLPATDALEGVLPPDFGFFFRCISCQPSHYNYADCLGFRGTSVSGPGGAAGAPQALSQTLRQCYLCLRSTWTRSSLCASSTPGPILTTPFWPLQRRATSCQDQMAKAGKTRHRLSVQSRLRRRENSQNSITNDPAQPSLQCAQPAVECQNLVYMYNLGSTANNLSSYGVATALTGLAHYDPKDASSTTQA